MLGSAKLYSLPYFFEGLLGFELTKASCVAVGTFNIYIIQPDWLRKVGIFPEKTEISIEASLDRPGFRLTTPGKLKNSWVVFPGKLAIESDAVDVDCGAPMAQVLENLKWTPVFGLGSNVTFQAKRNDVKGFPALELLSSGPTSPEGFSESSRALGFSVVRAKKVFNLGVTVSEDVVQLLGNAHVELSPDGEGTEPAVRQARAFGADIKTLIQLFDDVFGVRLL